MTFADTTTTIALPDLPPVCPRGHSARDCTLLPNEVQGDISAAMHCRSCPANYVMVHGRWFLAPASDTKGPAR